MTDRSVKVVLKGDISDFNRAMLAGAASAKAFTKELDTSNERTTLLTQSLLAIGPALVPVGAAAVPAIAGLTNQLAVAGVAAGVTALAFSGVGDALKATNDYALEPSAANLEKMSQSLDELGPAGRNFVGFLQELRPQLQGLQDSAQAGLFPGAQEGIEDLMTRLPQLEKIVGLVASGMGELIADAGENLADPRWDEFFTFLETDARPTLIDMGRAVGNFAEGFANLWMAFDPLSDDFSRSFLDMARDFSKWSAGLDETEGFQEFVDYIAENGPKAWDALGGIGNALLQIVEAAAPVGSAALPVIEAVSDSIAAIADSDLGPVIIGVVSLTSAYSRLIAISQTANSSALGGLFGKTAYGSAGKAAKDIPAATKAFMSYDIAASRASMTAAQFASRNDRLASSMKGAAKIAGGVGGMAFVMSDLDDKMGLTNTAMLALAGSMAGPFGAAAGAGIGLVLDLAAASGSATEKIDALTAKVAASGPLSQGDRLDLSNAGSLLVEDGDSAAASERLNEALDRNKQAAEDAAFAEANLSAAMAGASQSTREQTFEILNNIAAHNKRADEMLAQSNAEIAYEQAVDDATATIKENGKNLDIGTEKGRENQLALDGMAAAWNNLPDASKNAAGAMEQAKAAYIRASLAAGKGADDTKRLADELFHLPPAVNVDVTARGAAKTKADIDAIVRALAQIKSKDIVIRTFQETYGKKAGGSRENGVPQMADGGLIHGPGGPRDDLVPIMASNKEFLVNAAATAANLPLLHAINSGAQVQRFANGGPVSGGATSTAVMDRSVVAAIGSAVARATSDSFRNIVLWPAPDGSFLVKQMGG